ncbi:hypothetical protein B0H34DRAFT_784978 [Crassisporium funariophilum]|nr:hypothetical protein B0H34DRAFT_784978 [Crassisporium funariophilum]
MPPKRGREQLARQNAAAVQALAPEVIAKRTKRHLDELERSNYAEPTLLAGEDDEGGNKYSKGRGRQIISDKRNLNIAGNSAAARKKKSTMNVRTALLYRKNLATLIEEAVCFLRILSIRCTALGLSPRIICSVCGYRGLYKCRRCAMPYCDRNCEGVHAETRCERRVV